MTPRRRIEGPVLDEVRMLAALHADWSPTQVHRAVNRLHGIEVGAVESAPEVVSLRTVQRIRQQLSEDESGRWTMADSGPEDVPLVLSVGRMLAEQPPDPLPWPRWPTRAVAEWIVKIRRAYPDLEPLERVYELAALANRGGDLLERVQLFLTYTPWRDDCSALADAVIANRVTWDVAFLGDCQDQVGRVGGQRRWAAVQREKGERP